jgi:CheY-like chemotaxis protein
MPTQTSVEKIPHTESSSAPKPILFILFLSSGTPTNHGFIIVQQNTYIAKPYAMPTTTIHTADTRSDNRNILLIEDEGEMCLLLNLILALEIGADDFLSKPFTKTKLLASVNALLN